MGHTNGFGSIYSATFNSCTKCMHGQPGQNRRPHAQLQGCMDDLIASYDWQATWVVDVLGLFSNVISMGVCTTRHWQTSG